MSKKLTMTPTIKTSNFSKPEKVACTEMRRLAYLL